MIFTDRAKAYTDKAHIELARVKEIIATRTWTPSEENGEHGWVKATIAEIKQGRFEYLPEILNIMRARIVGGNAASSFLGA